VKFKSLKIENFLTVGVIEAGLANKGLVLVQGENRDDTSQDSNGSGKSSFVDALCWCLYGSTARGVSGDAVINDTAGKNCRVVASIEFDGEEYKISRHRKYTKMRNRLIVEGPSGDLTLGTDKLTQEVVNKLVGATADVFCASVYAGQENVPDLPGMTDVNLKAIVEEAAGINQLDAAHKLARDKKNAIQRDLENDNRDLQYNEQKLQDLNSNLATTEARLKQWKSNHEVRVEEAKRNLFSVKVEKEKLTSDAETARTVEEITADLNALSAQLTDHGTATKQRQMLTQEAVAVEKKAAVQGAKVATVTTEVKRLKNKLDAVTGKLGEPCSECGRDHDESTLGVAHQTVKSELKSKALEMKSEKAELARLTEAYQSAVQRVSEFTDAMTDVSEIIAAQSELSEERAAASARNAKVEAASEKLGQCARTYKAVLHENNPYADSYADIAEQIRSQSALIDDARTAIKAKEYKLEVAEEAVHVFGPAGVRAHILDTVTPFLNDKTSEYLSVLSDGNIQAVWNTLGTTAKGEVREKFNIEVTSETGGDSFKKLSGGEKRKVRLATSMALQDLVASRATKPIDLFIADEVDAAIDESGLERLMTILKSKAEQVGTVLVISHSDLKSWISNSVTVVKEKGMARLEGYAL